MNVAVQKTTEQQQRHVARPLKVLIPLIQAELAAANKAGVEHYRRAGEMLIEVKGSEQVAPGSWGRWLSSNFSLSQRQAQRYMQLARTPEPYSDTYDPGVATLQEAIGKKPHRPHIILKDLFREAEKVNVTRLANERQRREEEVKLHRELALQLVDLGYRALATKLHPDRGGSRDAMTRLNTVRDELKEVAATRRFV